uniref:Thioredoxin domain-containing protein n=1 Tax=Anas platyrhynchos TaxID=8839 RepID=A0A8B9QTE1_ANAPL
MLCLKGLIVVDAFQAWCGPCKTVVDLFRKIRNEVSSDLLHFAVAEVDSIDALEKYRGKCEPVFLFYAVSDDLFTVRKGNTCHPAFSKRNCTVFCLDLFTHPKQYLTGLFVMAISQAVVDDTSLQS